MGLAMSVWQTLLYERGPQAMTDATLYQSLFAKIPQATPGREELGQWLEEAEDFRVQSGLIHILLSPYVDVLTSEQLADLSTYVH